MKKNSLILFIATFCLINTFHFTANADQKKYSIPIQHSPQFGPSDALITLIEFVDFQ